MGQLIFGVLFHMVVVGEDLKVVENTEKWNSERKE